MPGPSVGPASAFGVSSICGGGLTGLAFGSSTSGAGALGGVLALGGWAGNAETVKIKPASSSQRTENDDMDSFHEE